MLLVMLLTPPTLVLPGEKEDVRQVGAREAGRVGGAGAGGMASRVGSRRAIRAFLTGGAAPRR